MGATTSTTGAETPTAAAESSLLDLDGFLSLFESWKTEWEPEDIGAGLHPLQNKVEVSAALLNFGSVNNKSSEFNKLIKTRQMDVFLITETWLKTKNEDKLIKKARSQNFTVYHKMREVKSGGGVAIVVSNDLESKSVEIKLKQPDNKKKPEDVLEHVAAELKHERWDEPVLFTNVYRPPGGSFQDFLKVFQEILDQAKSYNKLMVTGDFNIWVDDENDARAKEFKSLLENRKNNGLVQHVDEPTHEKGHTLDLVIS